MLASSVMGVSNTTGHARGGARRRRLRRGAAVFAYFVGIALVGAGLGALVAHVAWSGFAHRRSAGDRGHRAVDRSDAIGAMFLQRYVIIVATAFGGAWTMIVGGLAIAGDRGAAQRGVGGQRLDSVSDLAGAGTAWVPVAWIVLGLIGTGVQLGITGRKRK